MRYFTILLFLFISSLYAKTEYKYDSYFVKTPKCPNKQIVNGTISLEDNKETKSTTKVCVKGKYLIIETNTIIKTH